MTATSHVRVHALRTRQGKTDVYAMFLAGERVLEVADIARLTRSDGGVSGFQRPEIRAHVRSIADYLDGGGVLFPNAIVLAMGGDVEFRAKRGTKNIGVDQAATAGVLSIPVRAGRKSAWIVDGQQRALALAESRGGSLPVPVVAFVSPDIAVHREQFILVNKARPLDRRLIDELLPSVETALPRDLARRRVPSALCAALSETPGSPFHHLVKRPSHASPEAVVTDSSLTGVIKASLQDPRGALASHIDPDGSADIDAMYRVMVAFWAAVRDVFPQAWGLPPERSRLMHAAGLAAMGVLMDQIMTRVPPGEDGRRTARETLARIAPHCRWTEGRWEGLDRDWDDIQYTSRDVRLLSNALMALERRVAREGAA
jgi:DGQHR domain-containing protein